MSVKIAVTDRNSKPVANVNVRVSWKQGGSSNATTGNQGLADLGCSGGEIRSITIYGKEVLGYTLRVNDEATVQVTYNK